MENRKALLKKELTSPQFKPVAMIKKSSRKKIKSS